MLFFCFGAQQEGCSYEAAVNEPLLHEGLAQADCHTVLISIAVLVDIIANVDIVVQFLLVDSQVEMGAPAFDWPDSDGQLSQLIYISEATECGAEYSPVLVPPLQPENDSNRHFQQLQLRMADTVCHSRLRRCARYTHA